MAEETVPQAGVQEVGVGLKDIVNGGHRAKGLLKGTPVWLQYLHGHVVLQTLDKVEHALKESKGWDIPVCVCVCVCVCV